MQTPISADDVLRVFRKDELQLLVASVSVTAGLIAIGFSLIRQRFDRLLSFFAWFAAEYGFRLWMQSGIFRLMAHPSVALDRLQMALNIFVAIPAFLFFEASGLIGRNGRAIVYTVCLSELCLLASIFLGVSLNRIDELNSILVIVAVASAMYLAFRQPAITSDVIIFRVGLTVFVVLVVWTNVAELLGFRPEVEFYGFAVLLCCLAYVAAYRALDRDKQLNSIQHELEIAQRIQLSILPAASHSLEHFSVATRYRPMTSVAGDFYEVLNTGTGAIGLLVADVSGHGVPAALMLQWLRLRFRRNAIARTIPPDYSPASMKLCVETHRTNLLRRDMSFSTLS